MQRAGGGRDAALDARRSGELGSGTIAPTTRAAAKPG
jgi:hypothetical protein